MKKSFAKLSIIIISTLCLSGIFAGCGVTPSNPNGTNGKLSIVGSTSVQPLAQELADAYTAKNKDVTIDVQGVGSTAGIKAINDGTCDIGTSSRELKAEEKEWKLTEHVVALDGIAVVVNPKNSVSEITKEQITKIFKGEIKNWKELGGIDKEIIVVSREAGSGTRGAFDELLKIEEKKDGKTTSYLKADALIAEGNGSVKANIAGKENAIGYISLGFLDNSLKALKVDGVEATVANVKNSTYAVSRPFIMLTKGEENATLKSFLEYVKGDEGQKIVSEKYISIK